VSQQLAKLEREAGSPLLERRGRGVVLTDAGALLARTAAQVLRLVEEAEVTLEEQRGQAVGELTLAAFSTAARGLLPAVLVDLADRHPALDVRVHELDPPPAVAAVARGELDVAVVHDWQNTPLAVPDPVRRVRLGDDVADVLLPAGHPLADRAALTPVDLADERWLCQPEGSICHDWLIRTFREAELEPRLAYSVAEYQTQLAMLARGIGVGLLPRLGRGPLPPGVAVVPLLPTPTRRVYAVWREQASRRPAIAVAVAALRAGWAHRDSAPEPVSPIPEPVS
jgi:DNA-binding transcriptional LysR family regulator